MPIPFEQTIFLGVKGRVMALDRLTGEILWTSELKGSDFVNVIWDGVSLIATTKGEAWGLDPTDGRVLWNNELKGCGYGLVTIASSLPMSPGAQTAVLREKQAQDERARQQAASD